MRDNLKSDNLDFPVLIGDIGGTNARFGIVVDLQTDVKLFDPVITDDYLDVQSAVADAVLAKTHIKPKSLVLAAAGPVFGNEYKLTNSRWMIKPHDILSDLNLASAKFMNDFPAQALGVLAIGHDKMHKVGGGEFQELGVKVVLGPGTSFGIATLIHAGGRWVIIPAEGACADLGLGTGSNCERELIIQAHLNRIGGRQTIESIICGPGLENLHQAICQADNIECKPLSAAQISHSTSSNASADEAVILFSTLLGRVAGNIALTLMATGGVYVTGGMAHKMLDQLVAGGFRTEFENKAPQRELAKRIPTWFVNHENAALKGLANYVRMPQKYDLTLACATFSS